MARLRERIDGARRKSPFGQAVRVVAVTKGVEGAVIQEAVACGLEEFGENRLQEAAGKVAQFPSLRWHMIGHLQSNKVRRAVGLFEVIQSVDRLPLAEEIHRQAERIGKVARALVQVNLQEDPSKFGFLPNGLLPALETVASLRSLKVLGLMTIAPLVADPEEARPFFRKLRRLGDLAAREKFPNCDVSVISMGMSQDFEVAIEEGSTMVRLGRAIFGEK